MRVMVCSDKEATYTDTHSHAHTLPHNNTTPYLYEGAKGVKLHFKRVWISKDRERIPAPPSQDVLHDAVCYNGAFGCHALIECGSKGFNV